MSDLPVRGSRLVVALVDQYAADDSSRPPWAVVPMDNNDLSQGFKEIKYIQLANAVNHAAGWLQQNLPAATTDFETLAYAGPKDIRYPILALAVAKVGRKLLLPSPFASAAAQAHLVRASGVKIFLYGGSVGPIVEAVISQVPGAKPGKLQVPELSEWLIYQVAKKVHFTKTWDEAKADPWLIFHTSGTTGLPKLIIYTHEMMSSLEAADLTPDSIENTVNRHIENRRIYTPLPSLHVIGMYCSLQVPVYLDSTLVVGPTTPGPTTPQVAIDTIKYGRVETALLPPSLIDSLCETEAGLACLRSLKYIYFAGAPLARKTAAKLLGYTDVLPGIGSTEAGVYFTRAQGDGEDWEYYTFRESMGIEFRLISNNLYEPVFVKKPGLERFQQIFKVYPELQEFPTKDLFSPHPSKPDRWKYIGRTDDMIAFSHGEDLYATGVEEAIAQHAGVAGVVVGGQGRARPFVLVEWHDGVKEDERTVEAIWPTLDKANEKISDLVKLTKELVLFATPEKKLARTPKGTIARRESEMLYADEIEALYQ